MKSSPILFAAIVLFVGCSGDDPATITDVGSAANNHATDGGDTRDADADPGSGRDATATPDMANDAPDAADSGAGADAPDADAPDAGPGADADAEPPARGDTCADAIDATADGAFIGNTEDAADDYEARPAVDNCPSGAASGPDIVYALSPEVETTYHLEVAPGEGFDPFLYVRADCAADACIDGTVLNGPGDSENLEVTVPGGSTYYVIVDGELGDAGGFTLTVTPR